MKLFILVAFCSVRVQTTVDLPFSTSLMAKELTKDYSNAALFARRFVE